MKNLNRYKDPCYWDAIRKERMKFHAGEPIDLTLVPQEIYESWQRSMQENVSLVQCKVMLDHTDWELLERHEKTFIEAVSPALDLMFLSLRNEDFCEVCLLNVQGIILKNWSTRAEPDAPAGMIRKETYQGTGAAPLCMRDNQLVGVFGDEHWNTCGRGILAFAVPLHDRDGTIRGAVSLSVSRTSSCQEKNYELLLTMATKLAEQHFALAERVSMAEKALDQMPEGIIVLSPSSRICMANGKAKEYLEDSSDTPSSLADNFPYPEIVEKCLHKKGFRGEKLHIHKGGTVSEILVDFVPSPDCGVLTFHSGLSEKRAAKQTAPVSYAPAFPPLLGSSPQFKQVLEHTARASSSDITVLIQGETGTGKELVAKTIHANSKRATAPFVVVNCGALPQELIQAELFGYSPNSFTNAHASGRMGKFEAANGGTLFLDEIGEMPMAAQVCLLRVLENHEVQRIGENFPRPIDVRVVAATNRDLREAVHAKLFRKDLFYRLNTMVITLPPLRERPGDIVMLAMTFLKNITLANSYYKKLAFSPEVLNILKNYSWPGNVRELRNVVESSSCMAAHDLITPRDLPSDVLDAVETSVAGEKTVIAVASAAHDFKTELDEALKESRGNVARAAGKLGISKSSAYMKIKETGLNLREYRRGGGPVCSDGDTPLAALPRKKLEKLFRFLDSGEFQNLCAVMDKTKRNEADSGGQE